MRLADTDLRVYAIQALPGKEIGINSKLGAQGWGGEGSSVDAKRPSGVYQPPDCLLRGSCFLAGYMPGFDSVYLRVNIRL